MPDIELISTLTCPFVQRSVIVLHEKDIPFKRTNIDLSDKPDWFESLSPMGKVPILCIDDKVLFESAVICEYLDDITPPSLHPSDPYAKALNKAWIEFASEILVLSYRALMSDDRLRVENDLATLSKRLDYLEENIPSEPFFNGADFSIADAAYAPFLLRCFTILEPVLDNTLLKQCPRVQNWMAQVLARPSVIRSIPEQYLDASLEIFRAQNSYLLRGMQF